MEIFPIRPYQWLAMINPIRPRGLDPGEFPGAYFLRLSKEWHSIPAGLECPFRPEWRAHSILAGMEWLHSIPAGVEWPFHSNKNGMTSPFWKGHSIPIRMEWALQSGRNGMKSFHSGQIGMTIPFRLDWHWYFQFRLNPSASFFFRTPCALMLHC